MYIRELFTFKPHPTNIDLVEVTTTCCECHHKVAFHTNEDAWFTGLKALSQGASMQKAFPDLKPEWRELLISRICPGCFDSICHD
jgi:hypothetical protein